MMNNNTQIIRADELLEHTGLSWTTLWVNFKSGNFPTPILHSPNDIYWLRDEVDAWLNRRADIDSIETGKFYVVWVGREPGVYDNWPDAEQQVRGFSKAQYKSHTTRSEAEKAFLNGCNT